MEVIKLTTKPQTLEAIKAGLLKEYTREIRPNTQAKYCDLDEDGYLREIDGVLQPRRYDVVQFACGHETYTCKIEDEWIELFEDENHELISYVENGEEYLKAQIVFRIGEKIVL
jgi:hypothetical protein